MALNPGEDRIYTIKIKHTDLPAICYVEIKSSTSADAHRSLKQIKLTQRFATWQLSVALALCALFSGIAVGAAKGGYTREALENMKFGEPAWKFAQSWSSTITIASTILAGALALGAVPELTQNASKSGYAILALFFAMLLVLAPFLFTASRKADPAADNVTVTYQGRAGAFFLYGFLTVFAALGQLLVLFLLIEEIFAGFGFGAQVVLLILFLVLAALICVYSSRSMKLILQLHDPDKKINVPVATELQKTFPNGIPMDSIVADLQGAPTHIVRPQSWPAL